MEVMEESYKTARSSVFDYEPIDIEILEKETWDVCKDSVEEFLDR